MAKRRTCEKQRGIGTSLFAQEHDVHASRITTRRDSFGHWSAHFAGNPWLAFGGDAPQTAALRLLTANPDGPQHIFEEQEAAGIVVFVIL